MSRPLPEALVARDAIDFHVHVFESEAADTENAVLESMSERFGNASLPPGKVSDVAAFYRERNMAAVVFSVDEWSRTGVAASPDNDEVLRIAAEHSDVLIPFVSVDPHRGEEGLRTAKRLLEAGARGFKFHPSSQSFFPNDRSVYPLYELIEEYRAIALFHSGQTGVGAGEPGGGGIRLKYSNPMALDDVAVDFPRLPIVIAHPSFPWQDEALSVAVHKPTVYIDLSGWSPKYFPPQLVQYTNTLLKDRVLFGSDYPLLKPERWIRDAESAGIREEVMPKLLRENALRLLGAQPE